MKHELEGVVYDPGEDGGELIIIAEGDAYLRLRDFLDAIHAEEGDHVRITVETAGG